MYYKYCQRCGRPSNGYPLCKSCYYQQQRENEYDDRRGGNGINIDLGAIVQGIATIVQCFKAPETLQQQQSEPQKVIEEQNNARNQTSHTQRKWKTTKGFYVKSQQERTISDFLTENGIYHVYEKHFDIGGEDYLLPDFYIKGPVMFNGKILEDIYIEHWGREQDNKYNRKREEKLLLYKQSGITLINTYPDDITNYKESLTHKLTHFKEHQINY